MTVFKTFWYIVSKNKGLIILYTIMLTIFGGINMYTSDTNTSFTNSKPNILIINNDTDNKVTNNLINYLTSNSNIKNFSTENEIKDALFYREIHYVIEIPKNYGKSIMENINPEISVKSTGDYKAATAELLLTKYIQIQNAYKIGVNDEEELINNINLNLEHNTEVNISSELDTSKEYKVAFFFNFASYSVMAIILFIVCIILSSFNQENIKKRITISKMNYKKHNRYILYASILYALVVWLLFSLLGFVILGSAILNYKGLIYILNLLVFTFTILTFALMISSLVKNKEALSGIVNVLSLGSAFICGAFVPVEWISSTVLMFARFLPSYWFINTNELLKTMEVIELKPVIINIIILLIFAIVFIILNNVITRVKQK